MLHLLAAFGLLAQVAMAAVPGVKPLLFRCGSENPPEDILATAKSMATNPSTLAAAAAAINVKTYFHVVTTKAAQGSVTQTQLNNQVGLFLSPAIAGLASISEMLSCNTLAFYIIRHAFNGLHGRSEPYCLCIRLTHL